MSLIDQVNNYKKKTTSAGVRMSGILDSRSAGWGSFSYVDVEYVVEDGGNALWLSSS